MNALAVIPHYNHSTTLENVIRALRAQNIATLIVDDGSDPAQCERARTLAKTYDCTFVARTRNGGKGAAVKTGLAWAAEQGYSHILQLDADGQHDPAAAEAFLRNARTHPTACICGQPQYSADAPKSRLYGRKITNFWLAINTASRALPDGMCGYRVYPVRATLDIVQRHRTGNRMDFDIEILVLLHRQGMPFIWLPVAVSYPADGVSHFQLWRDNFRISAMHARLFFSGLWWRIHSRWRGRGEP